MRSAIATRYRGWRNVSSRWIDEGSREVELANYRVGEGGGGNAGSRGVSGACSRQLNNQGAPHASSCGTKARDRLAFLFIVVGVVLSVLVPVALAPLRPNCPKEEHPPIGKPFVRPP